MFLKDPSAKPQRRAAEPRSFMSWSERAAHHAASWGSPGQTESRGSVTTSTSAPQSEATLSS
ncbi:MAG TPA: hypothetical protein VEA15_09355 [Caulobacteraceae bacterium]|nr:hypothetical protein [Caulobacteraceae bacterium]